MGVSHSGGFERLHKGNGKGSDFEMADFQRMSPSEKRMVKINKKRAVPASTLFNSLPVFEINWIMRCTAMGNAKSVINNDILYLVFHHIHRGMINGIITNIENSICEKDFPHRTASVFLPVTISVSISLILFTTRMAVESIPKAAPSQREVLVIIPVCR